LRSLSSDLVARYVTTVAAGRRPGYWTNVQWPGGVLGPPLGKLAPRRAGGLCNTLAVM